jgi:hypothetical protein
MKRPEFELSALPKTPLTGLAWEALAPYGIRSLYEPLMGTGNSLYEFKRRGIRVLGSEWLEGGFQGARALNENNSQRLSEAEMARFTPQTPPNLAHHPRFAPWVERGFFDEKQAAWLGYWRDQLDALPEATAGLLSVAVGWVMNAWTSRSEAKQSPSGQTAISFFMKRVNQWVWDNGENNLVMRGDSVAIAREVRADACYLYLPPPRVAIDMPDWLQEAWWQGSSVADLQAFYAANPFYGPVEDYQAAVTTLLDHLEAIPLWVVQYRSSELDPLWGQPPAWLEGRDRHPLPHPGLDTDERLLLIEVKPR